MEGFLLKFLLGLSDRIIDKYTDRFEKMFEAHIKAKFKKMGVTEEQVTLLSELNASESQEERFAIIKKIQDFSITAPDL